MASSAGQGGAGVTDGQEAYLYQPQSLLGLQVASGRLCVRDREVGN